MATIIDIGLTYKEAIWCTFLGDALIAIPVVLNGHIGTQLRVPFPIQARSSFGFHAAKGVVVVRIITALFWHALQTFSGSTVMVQVLTAMWPSFGRIPNTIPASQDIDSKTLVAHFVFWSFQLPFVLIPPHRMKWFFYMKAILMIATSLGIVGYLVHRAGTSGEIFDQKPEVDGSKRAWLTVYMLFQSVCGWATMATNIADVSRFVKSPKHQVVQAASLPLVGLYIGVMGMIACSATKVGMSFSVLFGLKNKVQICTSDSCRSINMSVFGTIADKIQIQSTATSSGVQLICWQSGRAVAEVERQCSSAACHSA